MRLSSDAPDRDPAACHREACEVRDRWLEEAVTLVTPTASSAGSAGDDAAGARFGPLCEIGRVRGAEMVMVLDSPEEPPFGSLTAPRRRHLD